MGRKNQITFKKGAKIDTKPIAGTRDFTPEDYARREWLFSKFKEASKLHGFAQYETPIIEDTKLYTRKNGEEITEQMYKFTDKSGRDVALRPEMTPSLTRLIMAKRQTMTFPIKWFSIPQCWRFEQITKGRKREHYQWNCDIWGIVGYNAEVELIACIVSFFKSIRLSPKKVVIKYSSRKLLDLSNAEILELDKGSHALRDKVKNCQFPDWLLPFTELCEAYGLLPWMEFDPTIIRGLSYYNGIVFEAFSRKGGRAICGGGRYDGIEKVYGGNRDTPACGFGMGDCVIMDLIKDTNIIPQFNSAPLCTVMAYNGQCEKEAIKVLCDLRDNGISSEMYHGGKMRGFYNSANKRGISYAILVAPDELPKLNIRFMDGGETIVMTFKEFMNTLAHPW